jgi:hypothetical protein
MATHRNTWKKRESNIAEFFGCRRNRLSGSSGRQDCDQSDTTHPRLFIEAKLRAAHTAVTLWDEVAELARKARKTPVVALAEKGRHDHWLLVREADLLTVAAERLAILETDELIEFEAVVRRLRLDRWEEQESTDA